MRRLRNEERSPSHMCNRNAQQTVPNKLRRRHTTLPSGRAMASDVVPVQAPRRARKMRIATERKSQPTVAIARICKGDDVVASKNSPKTRVCSRPRPAGGCQNRWNGTSRRKWVSLASGRSACGAVGSVRIGGFEPWIGVEALVGVVVSSSGTAIHVKWRNAGGW